MSNTVTSKFTTRSYILISECFWLFVVDTADFAECIVSHISLLNDIHSLRPIHHETLSFTS